jgi:hypothetical protein
VIPKTVTRDAVTRAPEILDAPSYFHRKVTLNSQLLHARNVHREHVGRAVAAMPASVILVLSLPSMSLKTSQCGSINAMTQSKRKSRYAKLAVTGHSPTSEQRLEPFVAKGRELFTRRQGQLKLGCTNCHDDN